MNESIRTCGDELAEINRELTIAYSCFEAITDPDLIESEIYRIKYLQAKQAYLIKLAKGAATV